MVAINLNTHDPEFLNASQDRDFTPLPDGEYTAQIIRSGKRTLKTGAETLEITWEILDGQFRKRQIFQYLNIYDPTRPKQLAFHRQKIFFMTKACGLESITDTVELHNKPCRITVRQDEYNGRVRNEIVAYKPIDHVVEIQPQAGSNREESAIAMDVPF